MTNEWARKIMAERSRAINDAILKLLADNNLTVEDLKASGVRISYEDNYELVRTSKGLTARLVCKIKFWPGAEVMETLKNLPI